MILKPVKFGAQLATSTSYGFEEHYGVRDIGKWDVIHERFVISDTEYLNLHGITDLQKIPVSCKPKKRKGDKDGSQRILKVIAFKREENFQEKWTFLCDSKALFLSIAKEFKFAYTLKATWKKKEKVFFDEIEWDTKETKETKTSRGVIKPNAKAFAEYGNTILDTSSYDAYCAFLKYLLEESEKERISAAKDAFDWDADSKKYKKKFEITGCKIQMPDEKKDFHPIFERCLICENWDFERIYDAISCFLPWNIKRKVAWEAEQLRDEYGKNFEKKDKILENYRQSVITGDILPQISETRTEIERWTKLQEDGIAEKDFGEKYLALLQEKMKILENEIRKELEQCDFNPEAGEEKKGEIIDWSENFRKEDYEKGVNWYQEYCTKEARLQEILENVKGSMCDLKIPQYFDFYHFGRTLIGNCLNENISQKDLDCAMMYFYGTDTAREAYRWKKRHEDKKKGKPGEREVDHVLKLLKASGNYRIVSKKWDKKERDEVIKLYNPDFIDEPRECDHIVVGKQGVFLIETKNLKDKLVVDKNGNWKGENGGIKNPVQQVDWTTKLLQSFLKGVPVIGIICLAHPDGTIEGEENCLFPVVRSDSLDRFIQNFPSKDKELSDEEMEECLLLIEKYRYQEN